MVGSEPAAFGRLCVETPTGIEIEAPKTPAAFGWLCVETPRISVCRVDTFQPPSGGCVLKLTMML